MALPARPCVQCGNSFVPKVRDGRVSKCCSKECRGLAQRRRREVSCAHCAATFEVEVGRSTKFCSVPCRVAASKKTKPKTCVICGAEFDRTRLPSGRLETPVHWARRTTCSKTCGSKKQGQTLRQSNEDAWVVGGRTLLARTCQTCGALKSPEMFRSRKDEYLSHECRACHRATQDEIEHEQWRETIGKADHYYEQWTGPQLEIAMRSDLTAYEAALMLGRTVKGVRGARHKVRHEPKWAQVAGLSAS